MTEPAGPRTPNPPLVNALCSSIAIKNSSSTTRTILRTTFPFSGLFMRSPGELDCGNQTLWVEDKFHSSAKVSAGAFNQLGAVPSSLRRHDRWTARFVPLTYDVGPVLRSVLRRPFNMQYTRRGRKRTEFQRIGRQLVELILIGTIFEPRTCMAAPTQWRWPLPDPPTDRCNRVSKSVVSLIAAISCA